MPRITAQHSFSDNFWSESSQSTPAPFRTKKSDFQDFLFSVDDTPDFHDPYSDLNLFLSQKIKQEMLQSGKMKKWSLKLQEELLKKITPEFQKKFPHYRLGVSALKKTWEKVSYFSEQLSGQKEAMTQDGKLNIHFFIRENFKQLALYTPSSALPAYHYAHQLAVKMSECIAAIDGKRPKLDHLAKMIWAVQRHLIPQAKQSSGKNPYEEYDKADKVIVRAILEITALDPQISQRELEQQVTERVRALQEVPDFSSLGKITSNISSLLAEKLYPTCAFHTAFPTEQKRAVINFIRRQVALCKGSSCDSCYAEMVRRILALYALASGLPKDLSDAEVDSAIRSSYPLIQNACPVLPQSVYAFIAAESVLMKNEEYCHSVDYVAAKIGEAYAETRYLPELKGKETEILEIAIWKILNESEGILEQLPYKAGQKIEEAIATTLIENPHQNFSGIVSLTSHAFKKAKEAMGQKSWSEIERKIHVWAHQGDMICRFLCVGEGSPLPQLVQELWQQGEPHESVVNRIVQSYLQRYPKLTSYAAQVIQQAWIFYKHSWYALKAKPEESSFDRFLKWHEASLRQIGMPDSLTRGRLEEICRRSLPLVPLV